MWQNPSLSSKRSAGFLSSFRYSILVPFDTRYLEAHLKHLGTSTSSSLPSSQQHHHLNSQKTRENHFFPKNYEDSMISFSNQEPLKLSFTEPNNAFLNLRSSPLLNHDPIDQTPLNGNIFLSPKRTILGSFLQLKTTLTAFNQGRIFLPQGTTLQTPETTEASSELRSWMTSFGAGFCAGTVARTATAPFDRLKFIYMLYYKGMEKPPSLFTGFKELYKKEGFRGLFKGNLVCILKASPESAIRLTVFEKLKSVIKDENTPNLDKKKLFIVGGLSGALANLAIFPMDVLRTRLAADKNGLYKGMTDAVKKIVKTEGYIRPFYRGANSAVIANVPTSGLNLMLYEALKEVAIPKNVEKQPPSVLYMGCAGISALVTCSIMFPLQVVTSRLIMRSILDKENAQKGMVHQIQKIYQAEGVRGFYKGYCPGTSKVILGNAMLFGCYEFMKRTFGIEFKKH